MWDLWWTRGHRRNFFRVLFDFLLSTFHQCYTPLRHKGQLQQAALLSDTLPRRTTFREQSSWKHNSCSATLSVARNLCDPKFQFSVYKIPSPVPISSQISPLHALPFYFFNIYFNIILPSTPRSSKLPHSFSFPLQKPFAHFSSYVPYTQPISFSLIWSL
jgi:hypothetical protein